MLDHDHPNCHAPVRGSALLKQSRYRTGISLLRALVFVGVSALAGGFKLDAEARSSALEIELPSVDGWQIKAIRKGNSVMCSARKANENGVTLTLSADTGKYRGGVWFLEAVSRNQNLAPNIEEAAARLSLNGKNVAPGKVLAVGDWTGNKRTATYVRFEFPAIDAYVKDIEAARVIEVQAQGLGTLKLEVLSPIITAIEKCQREALNSEFWKDATQVCN